MKIIIHQKAGSQSSGSSFLRISKGILALAIILVSMMGSLHAQEVQFSRPSWWFGVAGGANFNFYRGSTQQLNDNFTAPIAFTQGEGVGLYIAPLVEYHPFGSSLGFMFQAGYDSRSSSYHQETTPCNCPADLSTTLSYVTIEPSLRFAPFKSDLYFYVGPRFAFNTEKSFDYQLGINPAYPDQLPSSPVKGDLSHVKQNLVSMQIGAGYDIPLTARTRQAQFVISPFISFHPYFGQNPRSIETWNVSTLRAGIALKFGHGHPLPASTVDGVQLPMDNPSVQFSVVSPKNAPTMEMATETFPVRNYVFFDLGSTDIPDRYVMLRKDQVKDFSEDQVEVNQPKNFSGRSERQMVIYYNVLNILGDRLVKNPSATITLVGSSDKDPADGRKMAESVKSYLTSIFNIEASRITTEGRDKPKIPSEQPGGTLELDLLRAGDRRVSIESNAPALLMEFQNGPTASLKPIVINASQTAPYESYVTFNNVGAKAAFSSWSMEIKDEKGMIQKFGPYTSDQVSLPGTRILGDRPQGDYKVTMIGTTINNHQIVKREVPMHAVLWTAPKLQNGMRYSVLYEFNESKAIPMYEKYLTEIIIPKIPAGGKVDIRGYTDNIGDDASNLELSTARANDVKTILENGLAKAGRKDVTFTVKGYGEDEKLAPFDNQYPEERFYNRTVVIEIFPAK